MSTVAEPFYSINSTISLAAFHQLEILCVSASLPTFP
jgi:hypothetical protein